MLEYKELERYNNTVKVKFSDCGHIGYIKDCHLENNQFTCNKCSKLHNWEYIYDEQNGLHYKSDIKRQCKICGENDIMSNLIAIRKNTKDGIQFWYYHDKCLKSEGYNKESIEKAINSSPLEVFNKTSHEFTDISNLCGIYAIHNTKNNKRYVGSSYNLAERLMQHISRLKNNKHHSYKLQDDFNTFNQTDFEFEVLEILDNQINETDLHIFEQKYIDLYNSYYDGYNAHPVAGYKGSTNDYYFSRR